MYLVKNSACLSHFCSSLDRMGIVTKRDLLVYGSDRSTVWWLTVWLSFCLSLTAKPSIHLWFSYYAMNLILLFWHYPTLFKKKELSLLSVIIITRISHDFSTSYSMFFLECTKRNLYISAPAHHSKMRIAPFERAWKTILSMFFLIFPSIIIH